MDQYHIKEDNNQIEKDVSTNSIYDYSHQNAITGDSRFLYYQLKVSILKADKIDIIVSFLMESGVRLILEDLIMAIKRGVRVRILTGNYLGITQPSALFLSKEGIR